MSKSELIKAIEQICEEKGLSKESVIETIQAALAVAYRKDFGNKMQNIQVEFDPETGGSRIFDVKEVVEDELFETWEKEREEMAKLREAGELPEVASMRKEEKIEETKPKAGEPEAVVVEEEKRYDPKRNISLKEAKETLKKDAEIGEVIRTELFPPAEYGRMAAQTAKQVIIQKLREAERKTMFENYKGREGEVFNAIVQRVEGRNVFVDIGKAVGFLPISEQIQRERYMTGQRFKVILLSVASTPKGPELIVSRAHPDMVMHLFSLEVPEIAGNVIEIKGVAREAGARSKIAVSTKEKNIDPVGSCVGQRGARVQTVIAELGGEKIDIIPFNDDPIKFITQSLAPAKVTSIKLLEEEKRALAEVAEDQLSLAIGRGGQNVRLASQLTGWKIDIVKEGEEPKDKEAQKQEKKNEENKEETARESKEEGKEEKTEENKNKLEEKKETEEKPEEKKSEEIKEKTNKEIKQVTEKKSEKKESKKKKTKKTEKSDEASESLESEEEEEERLSPDKRLGTTEKKCQDPNCGSANVQY